MCNHYRQNPDALPTWREYAGFDLPGGEWSETQIDVWPRRTGVVARVEEGKRILDQMTWGVPHTMAGKRPGTTVTKHVTNVRNLASPFWRSMIARPSQRCLVPFSTFAEPKAGQGKEEWWFSVNDAPVSCFAGIWRPSAVGNVYAFLTCEPNALVAPLHPKAMPVILHPEDYDTWLSADYEGACELAQAFPSQLMAVA